MGHSLCRGGLGKAFESGTYMHLGLWFHHEEAIFGFTFWWGRPFRRPCTPVHSAQHMPRREHDRQMVRRQEQYACQLRLKRRRRCGSERHSGLPSTSAGQDTLIQLCRLSRYSLQFFSPNLPDASCQSWRMLAHRSSIGSSSTDSWGRPSSCQRH